MAETTGSMTQRICRLSGFTALIFAGVILAINLLGFLVPMRHADIDGYVDFAQVSNTTAEVTLTRLDRLQAQKGSPNDGISPSQFVTEATRIIHEGMAHVDPDEVESNGFAYYGMSVPITENWILFALRFLKPDTYIDYEFCSYRRAVARGTGRCGQQSLALVSFLSENNVRTGFVALGGHAIATAEVNPGEWYLLDPDFGGVIPYGIQVAEQNPDDILQYYWNRQVAEERNLAATFLPANEVKHGGVEARYGRACYIETAAYILKWLAPLFLLGAGLWLTWATKRVRIRD